LSAARDLKTLDMLEKSAERGAGLVKQILGFAHTSTGEFRPTQVKHLARDLISVIEQTFPKSIQLEQQIPSDLWPVQGNATQIHQVLLNLCVNARDAMPSGGTLRLTAANLRLDASCGLKHGIYAVRVGIGDMRYDGVASFGVRPTFDNGAPLLEVFLFDFDGDLYGQTVDVAFIGWIRHEQKFESIEALTRHMTADVAQARDALKRAGKAFPKLGEV